MTSIFKKSSMRFLSAFLACLFFLMPGVGIAQESVTFSVSPTIFDMTATPGQTFQSTLRIINTNPFELRIFISVNTFVPKGEDGIPQFLPRETINASSSRFADWISTDEEIIIGAEQTLELPFAITVPGDAAPGGHYAAFMISTKPTRTQIEETKVQTSQVISSLLFLRVAGDITESSSIRSFRTSSYLLSKPETTFELRIENKGNVHVQPQGQIKIFNMWGQERGVIPINQQTLFGNVLPKSVRKYAFTWESEWSVTDIGRYTAVATLAYGVDDRHTMTADTAFWIIPWKILLLVFAVVGGFVALMSWAIKLYVRRMLALAGVATDSRSSDVASVSILKGKKRRATAPLEAGILDLRARLTTTSTIRAQALAALAFVKSYWKFFVSLAALISFLALTIWFIRGATAPYRPFEVRIEDKNQVLTTPDAQTKSTASAQEAAPQVSIVNRSGDEALTTKAQTLIEAAGYTVGTITSDSTSVEERTVIIYTASAENDALRLSQRFNNALLSAYSEPSKEQTMTLYIGTDLASLE